MEKLRKFEIDENKRCFLNGVEITHVLKVDIININPLGDTEVAITVSVDEIDVRYKSLFAK